MNHYAIVLAAGKGTRLNCKDRPKVMFEIQNKPMIDFVVETIAKLGIKRPVIVIGFKGEIVKKHLGSNYKYIWQTVRLGTGHAVAVTKDYFKNKSGWVYVANGDNPFFRVETYEKMLAVAKKDNSKIVIADGKLNDQFPFGRIIRDAQGEIVDIIEEKDATPTQKKIQEKNCGIYLFEIEWLFKNLPKIRKSPVSGEYYLTDLVRVAAKNKDRVSAVRISSWHEAVGINTFENLEVAHKIAK